MFETEFRINRFLFQYAQKMIADIPDARMAEQPLPGVNHPTWILGHIALSAESAAALFGAEKQLPATWHELFGQGSTLTVNLEDYPPKADLLQAVQSGFERAQAMAASASADDLTRPNTHRMLRPALPTVGDLFTFLLTTHFSLHLGQLSSWRRMIGLAPLF
jgi:hypothetical protein